MRVESRFGSYEGGGPTDLVNPLTDHDNDDHR